MKMPTITVIACLFLAMGVAPAEASSIDRPATWAQPLKMEGVPNLHKVTEALYRSAQPTATGMRNLKEMGVQTIVNLRSFHSDRGEIGDSGLAYEHIYMKTWHPEEEDAVRFLQIVIDPKRTPVLVHCQHGADRTGAMCAICRVVVEGWSKDEAIREMTQGGFGFHEVWGNLPLWIKNLDPDRIRKRVGIKISSEKINARGSDKARESAHQSP